MSDTNLYCDESCQNNHHYMAIGSIKCDTEKAEELSAAISEIKKKHGSVGELKWEKVSPHTLEKYIEIIEWFFQENEKNTIHFHSIVINCHELNHFAFNEGDSEIGFSKFIYQLLLKHCRIYSSETNYHTYLDSRTTKHSPGELMDILNNGSFKNYKIRPFKRVEFRDSEKFELIQVCDLITGAIAYRKNEKDKRTPVSKRQAAKTALTELICRRARHANLCNDTPPWRSAFTIWNMRLEKREAALARTLKATG